MAAELSRLTTSLAKKANATAILEQKLSEMTVQYQTSQDGAVQANKSIETLKAKLRAASEDKIDQSQLVGQIKALEKKLQQVRSLSDRE